MKLIQLNIWGGKLQYQIGDFLEAQAADVVCMQEVNDLEGPSGSLFATFQELKDQAGYEHSFLSPAYSYKYMHRQSYYGNGILSKHPLLAEKTVFTNGDYKDDYDFVGDDINVRNFQHVVIEVNGKPVNILNHHGYYVHESKAGNEATVGFTQMIADYISGLQGAVILCGDFNLAPNSESIEILNKQLINLSAKNGLTNTYTQFSWHNVVCDYIFVNDFVQVKSFIASEQVVSDHKALILEFGI